MNSPEDEGEHQFLLKRRNYNNSEAFTSKASRKRYCSNENEQERHKGVSATLKLYEDPWKIKKTLTNSELGISSGLLLATALVKNQILPMLGVDNARAAPILKRAPQLGFGTWIPDPCTTCS